MNTEDRIQDLLSENEALRSAIRRGEEDFERAAALVEEHLATARRLERELARMEARVLFLEDGRRSS